MKKLVHAIGVIHNNQRAFWKDVNGSLQSIQGQVMSAQDRLRTIDSVVNSMVPHGMFMSMFLFYRSVIAFAFVYLSHILNLLYLSVMHFNQSLYILLPVYSHLNSSWRACSVGYHHGSRGDEEELVDAKD